MKRAVLNKKLQEVFEPLKRKHYGDARFFKFDFLVKKSKR
jgi:hypothetical protein